MSSIRLAVLLTLFLSAMVFAAPSLGQQTTQAQDAEPLSPYETYLARKADLVQLSAVFGELHYLRRMCEPRREANIWRERMQTLIKLETPDSDTHRDMVVAFNDRFRSVQETYPECDQDARRAARDLAFKGSEIANRLSAPLEAEWQTEQTARWGQNDEG